MKSELEKKDLSDIASLVIARLIPLLSADGKNKAEDTLMTIEEAAKFLKTSKGQIYQWVNNSQHGLGSFPYFKAGKLLRFSQKAILKWLEDR
ncbi:MAG TPA: helix-turn-helix domain-containing protein [Thermodesulfovibrionales bacterium]|nr:helix-turn-helix domain-containing protein [Thermodesulfovibrionales bacterium]